MMRTHVKRISVSRLLPWSAGGQSGALVVVDGGIADDGSSLGKVAPQNFCH